MKKYLVLIAVVLGSILSYSCCSTSTYRGRLMKWRASDIEDYKKFPSVAFEASSSAYRFTFSEDQDLPSIKVTGKNGIKRQLNEVLEDSKTTAFLVIRKDTILYEQYFNGYERQSMNTSFSVAKSITSLIAGVAIDEGLIGSEDDPVTAYFPELLQIDSQYADIKIAHLLDMRSGIQFKDHDLPWGDKPKAYYDPSLRERLLELPVDFEPNSMFQYNSYNPILLGMIIEKASGMSPAEYFKIKIWDKLNMEYSGSWSLDSEHSRMTKMESGLNLRAVDFAKFGKLVLEKGSWNDKQIISEKWIESCVQILPKHQLKEFGNEVYYENFWWLYSKNERDPYIISGNGHLGQYLFMFPNEQMILVRMGKSTGNVDSWAQIFREVVEYCSNKISQ